MAREGRIGHEQSEGDPLRGGHIGRRRWLHGWRWTWRVDRGRGRAARGYWQDRLLGLIADDSDSDRRRRRRRDHERSDRQEAPVPIVSEPAAALRKRLHMVADAVEDATAGSGVQTGEGRCPQLLLELKQFLVVVDVVVHASASSRDRALISARCQDFLTASSVLPWIVPISACDIPAIRIASRPR